MELLSDVSCGHWLLDRVGDWARVGGVAGSGFEAYARILHPVPASLEDLTVMDEWGMHPVLRETRWPWSEVAGRVGCTMHPLVQWNRLAEMDQGVDFSDGWRVGQTQEGFFDLDLLAALAQHLAVATRTPDDIVAGVWDGWGELHEHASVVWYVEEGSGLRGWWAQRQGQRAAEAEKRVTLSPEVARAAMSGPFLQWPARELLLFSMSLFELADPTWPERAGIGVQPGLPPSISPQLLWPADHSWVVASEIDWDSTIVAGPRSLVDAVLGDERFEAFEVDEDADLTYEGDLINPPRGG